MRTLSELVDAEQTGMAAVRAALEKATRPVELLTCEPADGEKQIVALQLDTRIPLGAVAHGSGGLLVDHGWLRILGAGCARLSRDLAGWNQLGQGGGKLPGAVLVADDVTGGFFAVNQGGLVGNPGDLCWLSPQTLDWEGLGVGYDGFLSWAVSDALVEFYSAWRWPAWEEAVQALPADQAFTLDPPAAVVGAPFAERTRAARSVDEVWTQHSDTLARLLRAPGAS